MLHRRRLVGAELFCSRPGESAAFYAWLLSTDAETGRDDWEPVRLLFDRAVVGLRRTSGGSSSNPMWVPVIVVDDADDACRRMEEEGGVSKDLEGCQYLVDPAGIWTRIVAAGRLPVGLDPEVVKRTVLDYQTADVAEAAESYARVLGLEVVEFVEDDHDYTLLVDDRHIALGVVNYTEVASSAPTEWILYFDVPDVHLAVRRAVRAGAQIVIETTQEGYNEWCVLKDPFGVTFGLSTYFDLEDTDTKVRVGRGGMVVSLDQAARLD